MKQGKLPELNSEEWKKEIAFYQSADTSTRWIRATSLGYTNPDSYMNAMHRRGIRLNVPMSRRERFNKPVIVKEPCLIIFDSQIPFHDAEFINKLLELSVAWGIKQGISGGDFLNMTAFSNFFEKPEDKVWAKEREVTLQVIQALHDSVPNWLLIKGNHEDFLLKKLAEQIGHDDILALLDRREGVTGGFTATDYYHCKVMLGGSVWRITHPRNISVIHSRIPQRLCDKFHTSIASGHGHLAGMTPDYSGKYFAVDVGITADPERLDYVMMRDSTRPEMCQGALILQLGEDGHCYPYHLYPNSDWVALRRLYGDKH